MGFYSLAKPLLFCLDSEKAHHFTLNFLEKLNRWGLLRDGSIAAKPQEVMGLTFPNSVGLAGGFVKTMAHVDAMAALGFGFIEMGTLTPEPQSGNPKPRLFRLKKESSLINRMGFPNPGIEAGLAGHDKLKYKGILGVNIGKNSATPLQRAVDDYQICLKRAYSIADYITINVSSPNTQGLRQLQSFDALSDLLLALKKTQAQLTHQQDRYVPLIVKIAPDLSHEEITNMVQVFIQHNIDGVIATNTSVSREGVKNNPLSQEQGGLSGRALKPLSDHVLDILQEHLQGNIPIIACGGVQSVQDAQDKLRRGASLIQVYTGLVYQGPGLVKDLVKKMV